MCEIQVPDRRAQHARRAHARDRPEGLLKVGEAVRVEIDRIGSLTNTVIDEPEGFVAEPTNAATACALSVLG